MQDRYRVYCRRNGVFYLEDALSRKQESLGTRSKAEARRLLAARNQAAQQPLLNRLLARTYLSAASPEFMGRTWAEVMADIERSYAGPTLLRWQLVTKSKPFRLLHSLSLVETGSEHFLAVLRHPAAGSSTNLWLRRLHNHALDMGWLLQPVLPRRAWPRLRHGVKQAVSWQEHEAILANERNPERKLFYAMLWETGGAQSDIANLRAEDVNGAENVITFQRQKLTAAGGGQVCLVIGEALHRILEQLPCRGLLFLQIQQESSSHRAQMFKRICTRLKIKGKTLHSYRYAWAERACKAGMPEREAMVHLGHKSAAIHYAYAKRAKNVTMPLEFYEQQKQDKIVKFQQDDMANNRFLRE